MKLGDLVRDYRVAHDLSQRQFAQICGVSNGTISNLESGINPNTGKPITPTMELVKKLSTAMCMTMTELMTVVDDMPIYIGGEQEDCAPDNSDHSDIVKVGDDFAAIVKDSPIMITGQAGSGKSNLINTYARTLAPWGNVAFGQRAGKRPISRAQKQSFEPTVFVSYSRKEDDLPAGISEHLRQQLDAIELPEYNLVYTYAKDGTSKMRRLNDEQFSALNAILDQMPDTEE